MGKTRDPVLIELDALKRLMVLQLFRNGVDQSDIVEGSSSKQEHD